MKRILSFLLAALDALLVFLGCFARYDATAGEELAQTPFSAGSSLGLFASSADLTLPFNAVCRLFGGSDRDHTLVFRFGNEPTYFEWIALKTVWTGDAEYVRELKDKIAAFPQTDNGYLWSWGTSTYWPTRQGSIHYDGLFRYVAAVSELIRWDGKTDFLEETDTTTTGGDKALDASAGRTVYEKCKAAMDYAYDALDGRTGLITLTEKSVFLSDGVTRFDKNASGAFVWNNTGRAGSAASNYWDNLCFGHCDAYETMLYYHALTAMRSIETMRGNPDAADAYASHAALVKARFNQTFWSSETGRYIACIDADGKRWDPGLTFLNTEALAYGLGDAEKAGSVFDWLDGKRIVSGDTVTGKDITDYSHLLKNHYGKPVSLKHYRFAPITNTVSIEALSGNGPAWWYDLDGAIPVGEGAGAAFGRHLENGGYIFYPLYYALTARAEYLGADSVKKRAGDLADVYRFNGFHSDAGGWMEGMTGEFPESGIVSRVYVSSLCGIEAQTDALVIRPALPSGIKHLGIDRVRYGDSVFEIRVGRTSLALTAETAPDGKLVFYPEKPGIYNIRMTYADGTAAAASTETDARGAIVLTGRNKPPKTVLIERA